jgi:hypothetical protein
MDDGIVFLPDHICKDTFLAILNEMDSSIVFTLEESEKTFFKNKEVEKLNFLDLSIMVDQDGITYTDVFYKPTNSHDYLHFDSFHPNHTLQNIPFCLAKRIVVFCSDGDVMEERLSEMKQLLIACKYPTKVIEKGIFNAKLQGPAPPKTNRDNIITYTHQNMSNFKFNHILTTASNLLKNARSDEIRHIFKDIRFIEATSQPKNILRTITSTKRMTTAAPGIYAECTDPRCMICKYGYIENCSSFTTSNGKTWEIRSHINCNDRNVIYYLECRFCNGDVTKTGKTKTKLRERVNNHISECASGNTTDVFDLHCHQCGAHRKEQPYFKIRAFMKLETPDKLLTYEKLFHERKYATINS